MSLISALGVWACFLGPLHTAFDTAALMLPAFVLAALPGLFIARSRFVVWVLGASVVTGAAYLLPPLAAQRPGADLRLYSKNLLQGGDFSPGLAQDILAADADVVTLQEASPGHAPLFNALRVQFPYQHVCDRQPSYTIAVLSRHPFTGPGTCSSPSGVGMVRIDLRGTQVTVASVHMPWPWPYDSGDNEAEVKRILAAAPRPMVIAGDFNSLPWTGRILPLAHATGTRLAGPMRLTLRRAQFPLPLPLDHALAPGGGATQTRPAYGSDHLGLVADLSLR